MPTTIEAGDELTFEARAIPLKGKRGRGGYSSKTAQTNIERRKDAARASDRVYQVARTTPKRAYLKDGNYTGMYADLSTGRLCASLDGIYGLRFVLVAVDGDPWPSEES